MRYRGVGVLTWTALVVLWACPTIAQVDDLSFATMRDWAFYNDAGWNFLLRGDYVRAQDRFITAIKRIKNESKDDPRLLARSYHDLSLVLYYQKRYAEAEPLASWALSVREKHPKVKPGAVFQSLYMLGMIHVAQRHYKEAEILFKRALALQEASLGPDHASAAPTYMNLASVYRDQSKYSDAETFYKRAIALQEQTKPDENLELAETLEHYGDMLRRMIRNSEAEAVEAQAKGIRDTVAERTAAAAARVKAARIAADFEIPTAIGGQKPP